MPRPRKKPINYSSFFDNLENEDNTPKEVKKRAIKPDPLTELKSPYTKSEHVHEEVEDMHVEESNLQTVASSVTPSPVTHNYAPLKQEIRELKGAHKLMKASMDEIVERYNTMKLEKEILEKKIKRIESQVKASMNEKLKLHEEMDLILQESNQIETETNSVLRNIRSIRNENKNASVEINQLKTDIEDLEAIQRKCEIAKLKKRKRSHNVVGMMDPFYKFMSIHPADIEDKWKCSMQKDDTVLEFFMDCSKQNIEYIPLGSTRNGKPIPLQELPEYLSNITSFSQNNLPLFLAKTIGYLYSV